MYSYNMVPHHELYQFFEVACDKLEIYEKSKQAKLLKFIEKYIRINGSLPTLKYLFDMRKAKLRQDNIDCT